MRQAARSPPRTTTTTRPPATPAARSTAASCMAQLSPMLRRSPSRCPRPLGVGSVIALYLGVPAVAYTAPTVALRLMLAGFVGLLANSAYLAVSAAPTLWYFANVALHPILGLVLAVALIAHRPLRSRCASAIGLAGGSLGRQPLLAAAVLALAGGFITASSSSCSARPDLTARSRRPRCREQRRRRAPRGAPVAFDIPSARRCSVRGRWRRGWRSPWS